MPSSAIRVKGYFENISSPTNFSLKRAVTTSTKESHTTNDSATSAYFNFPSYNQEHTVSGDSSYDESNGSTLTSRYTAETMEKTVESEGTSVLSQSSDDEETIPSMRYPGENSDEEETVPSLECKIVNKIDSDKNKSDIDPILEAFTEDDNSVDTDDDISEANTETAIADDQIVETNTTNGSVSLGWDHGRTVATACRTATKNKSSMTDVNELPEGVSKSDITVTIDIDDEARSSRASELNEEDLDVEILHHKHHRKNDSGEFSPRKQNQRARRNFEQDVQKSILEDLQSFYTASPKTAKLVLCIVVSVLSDGTLDHTFWSGGRVGLTEIVLQWVLFDADDLQVYKRGRVVRKKDFGFGPLGLTENEGQHYLLTKLVPRASNEIISKIGNGTRQDLLSEF